MIKIEVEKVLSLRGKEYKIVSVEVIEYKDLPKEYLEGYPKAFKNYYGGIPTLQVFSTREDRELYVEQGETISQEKFHKIIEILKKCGERLHRINEERRKISATWRGFETYVI